MLSVILAALVLLPGPSASGEALYRLHCSSCHGENAQGSNLGPSLMRKPAVLVHFMLDTGRMPTQIPWMQQTHKASLFSESQINALVGYVSTLSRTADTALPKVFPGNVDHGRTLYAQNCEHCHGAGGEGGSIAGGYEHVAPSLMQASGFQVAEAIRAGPGSMPRFGSRVLSDANVNDIASYVNTLQTQDLDPGGIPLSNVGPVPEGLVAWIVGLGLLVILARRLGKAT